MCLLLTNIFMRPCSLAIVKIVNLLRTDVLSSTLSTNAGVSQGSVFDCF